MDVVVIGAGLSGLTAAVTLQGKGADVQVLEAGPQIGGRIRALRDPDSGQVLADLGPTWVWPKYQPVAARWLQKLGVETFEQFNDGNAVITGYGPSPLHQPLPGQDGMVRPVGGPTALIDALSRELGSDRVRTSSTVTGIIEDGSDRIAVQLASGEVITARRVILSIPSRVAATTLHLPWAPPSLTEAMRQTPTWMSTTAKAVAVYDRPFWRDSGLSGRIASRYGPLVEAHDHSGIAGSPAAIFGFVGWSLEQRQNDPDGLRQAILTQLADCLGEAAGDPVSLKIEDWAINKHIVTDLDLSQPPHHPDVGPNLLRQPYLGGRLRFAVSEVALRSPGLIEGAFDIGEAVAAAMTLTNS
ncbi:MAG: NAD(P)/FAD-dependent oxidoreductase [Flavimaricola sp.]|nr:NAD(P)/FAD-dependent oxidoreductase [Flavimaricola sp.]